MKLQHLILAGVAAAAFAVGAPAMAGSANMQVALMSRLDDGAALERHGRDDGPRHDANDDRGGRGNEPGEDRHGRGNDDPPGDDHGGHGRGNDDPPGDDHGHHGRGHDDGPNHT